MINMTTNNREVERLVGLMFMKLTVVRLGLQTGRVHGRRFDDIPAVLEHIADCCNEHKKLIRGEINAETADKFVKMVLKLKHLF